MATFAGRPNRLSHPASLAAIVVVAYAAFLIGAAVTRHWPVDADGHPILLDYLGMWAAGRLALAGQAAAAYDFAAHKAVEVAAVGYPFDGYFSWFYPPTFFFATAPFSLLPFVPALLAWGAAGLTLFLGSIRLVVPRRGAMLLAAAAPVVLANAAAGQNGFFSAALIAGALALIDRRPVAAGVLIACLTFKPQFGLLIPVALACGGYWRVFASAAIATVVLAAASATVFGTDAWAGFLGSIDVAYRSILVDNSIGAEKLQSPFGIVRLLGGDIGAAWTAQAAIAVPAATFVALLWRSSASIDLKAAALAAGTVLVTPYVLIYDLVILVVPVAFLARTGLSRPEALAVTLAGLLVIAYPVTSLPVGLAASLMVAGLVVARVVWSGRKAANLPEADRGKTTSSAAVL